MTGRVRIKIKISSQLLNFHAFFDMRVVDEKIKKKSKTIIHGIFLNIFFGYEIYDE